MEPPRKRLRLSPRHEAEYPSTALVAETGHAQSKPRVSQPEGESPISHESIPPTRTFDIFDLRRRDPGHHNGVRLLPRLPDVTVTANVINIAIMDGSNPISTTQIPAPTVATEIPIGNLGTLTLSDLTEGSSLPTGLSTSDSPSPSVTGTLSSSASSTGNGTSTDRTVTVTATSMLPVSVMNSTLISTSNHKSTSRGGALASLTDVDSTATNTGSYNAFATIFTTSTNGPSSIYASHATVTASTSKSTATNTGGGGGGSGGGVVLTPQQQQMVGGVVGGVAGVAIVLLGILYFLKWYRHRLKIQGRLPEQLSRHRQLPSDDDHPFVTAPTMVDTSSSTASTILPVAALKQSILKMRPHSTYTLASSATDRSSLPAPESERSFQRVSGRKIPSVLLTGGDGYGEQASTPPVTGNFSYPRSREMVQTSPLRGMENSAHSSVVPAGAESVSGYSTPTRPPLSPFLDPVADEQNDAATPLTGSSTPPRRLASRSQLSIQTGGLSAFNSNRFGDGNILIKPSPARTPTTTSPTGSSLHLPMHTPPLMSGDIPAMPPLNPFQHPGMGPRKFSDDAVSFQRSLGPRSTSAFSVRSSGSVGGKFKEEI